MADRQPVVECLRVWKIFGDRALDALRAVRHEGLGKTELFEQFGCVLAVADASFVVTEGEIFCIMGLSGSGKSTLVRHINRLIEPTAGEIFIKGAAIGGKTADELRQMRALNIGMVFQNIALFPHRTVRDNVAFGLEVRQVSRERRYALAEEKLALVQLSGWGDRLPEELSGGMQQRVGLARALAADPDILLMDEPFSALDPLIRRKLQTQLLELARVMGKTTLFITHDLDEAIRLGHRIAIMRDGRLVQIGTPEEIVTAPADDYVAEFVAGISRLKLVYAHSIMEPVEAYQHTNGALDLWACPKAREDADLDQLINLAIDSELPTVIADSDGKPVGLVSKRALLRGLQGRDWHGKPHAVTRSG
jgi:glycine betaine/proline transport system ATP-binding protein